MRDEPRTGRPRRNVLLGGGLLLLTILGASTVFSQSPGQGPAPSGTPTPAPAPTQAPAPAPVEKDPLRGLLLLEKEALQAEIKAAQARVGQSARRLQNARASNRAHLQSDDYVNNAEVDVLERQAIVARKQAELKEITTRLESSHRVESFHRGTPQEGSTVDITDDLLRRIKDLEARVEKLEGAR